MGTDHGYLPAALYLSGGFLSITATDISHSPIENAKKNFNKLGIKDVNLICSDGLRGVAKQDAEYTVIAGMGGDVISGIIDRCSYKNEIKFILQPMTAAKTLREYLAKNGFSIEKETAVKENNKLYSVMLCSFSGSPYSLSMGEKYIGAIKPDSEVNIQYIKKQYNICKKCADSLVNVKEKAAEYKAYKDACTQIAEFLEGHNGV
ncbi:MAG: SAM-dependent methyltransferase [Clostridia bacterium]|nr:SAM-dependent methyltransferase [Clostridia bacterium]